MKTIRKTALIIMAVTLLTSCGKKSEDVLISLKVVKNVDLNRYKGTWYEIARFPHSFEKDLVGVTATYTLKEDGKIGVLNKGYKDTLDGKLKEAKAFAKVPYPEWAGYLRVFFFWPFGGDYMILELDQENYQYALVGDPSLNYLWVLSRTPK